MSVLAHQGGWDEALMVLAPLALLFGLLWLANRRARRQLEDQPADGSPGGTPVEPDDDRG